MRKIVFLSLAFLALIAFANNRNDREVVLHHGGGKGLNQVHVDPPQVTYDDELNQLTVYFGSTGNITLEYLDDTGTPYYYVYGESHVGYTIANYPSLPAGYYTITIHSIYGYTYTGNFSVS